MSGATFLSVFLDRDEMPIVTILGSFPGFDEALAAFAIDGLPDELRHGFRGGVVLETGSEWRGKLNLGRDLGLDHNEIRHVRLNGAGSDPEFLHTYPFPSRAPAPGR